MDGQTEKNPKKKGLNRNILSTDILTLPLYYIKLPISTAALLVVNSMNH